MSGWLYIIAVFAATGFGMIVVAIVSARLFRKWGS